ncbi:MAG: MFS transporter [Anaerolineae bacterium]|nr:MFS transporter [Anaerolineae bacterium]
MTAPTAAAEPTTVAKLRGLRWNTLADSANTVFVQFTYFGSVFVLFLSQLGLSKSQIGLMLSFFPFAGIVAPLIAPRVARFGYKRTFITFWTLRKAFTLLLLLIPLVIARYGLNTALAFLAIIVAGFALCRAIAETGKYPWTQEYVPNHVRGKYSAVANVFITLTGLVAVAVAGFVLDRTTGLSGYMLLIAAGVLFGLFGVWAYAHIPGGAPVPASEEKQQRALRAATADPHFRRYLAGVALISLAITPMTSFLPLFMQEQVGLTDSHVVLLQNGTLVGGLISVYIWGWAADRFGSMPVMLSGIVARLFLPIFWLLMPRHSALSLNIALAIAFFQGLAGMGWAIGSARLLFVSIVPPEKKADYMALYYAWIGIVGGFSQLAGGWILQLARNLSGEFLNISIDPYTPLFLLGLTLPLISFVVLRPIRLSTEVGVGEFAGILFRGNPFVAVESMIRYHLARDEQATVLSTEKLGQARSLLTIEELLESLQDPRFNVRFEAIVAIGRHRPDERLVTALAAVLHGRDPALSVMAAWALGRIGSPKGEPSLRGALDSGYRSIRAHSARSLAVLGDIAVIPELRNRLTAEEDHGLRVAYAAALGQLGDTDAVPLILPLLYAETEAVSRQELALALARLSGEESAYIHMLRQLRAGLDTGVPRILAPLAKKWPGAGELIKEAGAVFSLGQYEEGIGILVAICEMALTHPLPPSRTLVLRECSHRLPEAGTARPEYLLLALHILAA